MSGSMPPATIVKPKKLPLDERYYAGRLFGAIALGITSVCLLCG